MEDDEDGNKKLIDYKEKWPQPAFSNYLFSTYHKIIDCSNLIFALISLKAKWNVTFGLVWFNLSYISQKHKAGDSLILFFCAPSMKSRYSFNGGANVSQLDSFCFSCAQCEEALWWYHHLALYCNGSWIELGSLLGKFHCFSVSQKEKSACDSLCQHFITSHHIIQYCILWQDTKCFSALR